MIGLKFRLLDHNGSQPFPTSPSFATFHLHSLHRLCSIITLIKYSKNIDRCFVFTRVKLHRGRQPEIMM